MPVEPAYDERGLVPCIVQDAATGTVVMLAWMNAEALRLTRETRVVHFWSRSRQALWKKGETSGHVQRVVEMRVDCDQDVLLLKVDQAGPGACHTGRRSCFYRAVVPGTPASLEFRDGERTFDPARVYGKHGTPSA